MPKRPPTIGFIGLGVMGLPMARNLLTAGYPMVVSSRTPDRAGELLSAGAEWAATPIDVARRSAGVITMLPDSPDVRLVVQGRDGLLSEPHDNLTWIDMSSVAPDVTRELAQSCRNVGVATLDAPVSGGESGAVEGLLSIMVGGSQETFHRWRPMLDVLGNSVTRVGEVGAGQTAKVCNQVVVGCNIAAVAEALMLAAKAGVDPWAVRKVLMGGAAQSPILDVHGQRMLNREFSPGFRPELHRKDLLNAMAAARSAGSSLPLTAIVVELLTAQIARGHGDLDHSALVTVYEGLAFDSLSSLGRLSQ